MSPVCEVIASVSDPTASQSLEISAASIISSDSCSSALFFSSSSFSDTSSVFSFFPFNVFSFRFLPSSCYAVMSQSQTNLLASTFTLPHSLPPQCLDQLQLERYVDCDTTSEVCGVYPQPQAGWNQGTARIFCSSDRTPHTRWWTPAGRWTPCPAAWGSPACRTPAASSSWFSPSTWDQSSLKHWEIGLWGSNHDK